MSRKTYSIVALSISIIFSLAFSFKDNYFQLAKSIETFISLYKEVNKNYVDEIDHSVLMEAGINGMLEKLDPYTNFISENKIEDYRTSSTNEFGSIGIEIDTIQSKCIIKDIYKNSPAQNAGLLVGDQIIEINNIELENRAIEDIHTLLKGQVGSTVTLQIQNPLRETTEERRFQLVREEVKAEDIPLYQLFENKVAYIKLNSFTKTSSESVKNAFLDLKDQGAEKLILDLRGNPGGLLFEAIKICNLFLPKGVEVVSTRGKLEEWNKSHATLSKPIDLDIPIAVLINNKSASASEIVAGTLQDYDRGVIVGQRSFGKGLVQLTRPLAFNSSLKVTVAKYYIPSGRCIQSIHYSQHALSSETPDSLRNKFQTQNGRPVFDGGGILPDIRIKPKELSGLTKFLSDSNYIFEYANIYQSTHEKIDSISEFRLEDSDYSMFADWVLSQKTKLKSPSLQKLEKLFSNIKEEGYKEEVIANLHATVEKLTTISKNDLLSIKEEITPLLEQEIISRYYFAQGLLERELKEDKVFLNAKKLLANKTQYDLILKSKP